MRGVVLSSLQDGFMLWQLPGYDTVLEVRRKTEMLANARAFCPTLPISFSDSWNVIIKGANDDELLFVDHDKKNKQTNREQERSWRRFSFGSGWRNRRTFERTRRASGARRYEFEFGVFFFFCSSFLVKQEPKSAVCHVDAPLEMPKVEQSRRPIQTMARPNPAASSSPPPHSSHHGNNNNAPPPHAAAAAHPPAKKTAAVAKAVPPPAKAAPAKAAPPPVKQSSEPKQPAKAKAAVAGPKAPGSAANAAPPKAKAAKGPKGAVPAGPPGGGGGGGPKKGAPAKAVPAKAAANKGKVWKEKKESSLSD